MLKYSFFVGLLLLFSAGENAEKATFVLYRGREFLGHAYEIKFNNHLVATIETNSFIEVVITPGKINIEASAFRGTKKTLTVTAEAGQVYFVKAYEEIDFWDHYLVMHLMDAEKAKKEVKKCLEIKVAKQPD
ncbi:hypothetical protein [Haliscomenobacter hydrossis]|uniref:DUF2846 domain-containing protein n=1 Tax=Haliscomenobacter hydrossis (strain ATCC 27775 / DSM 1100 / LMG 10767 / O) TaxID=760192 RepID=F4KSS7_HALH1|nr:hypothetical protein [Haliscomenobacter hydrossis]AEE48041.1 hypothetical protein Halhy_0128 [Haliscomenobacter hydrossis DSM 1100]